MDFWHKTAAAALSLFLTINVQAAEWTHGTRDFNRHAYVGLGLGLSHLNPDTSDAFHDVNDRVNPGGQITLGVDVSRAISLELHSADLGSAGLSPSGRINYHVTSASGLFYFGKNRKSHARHGLLAFGRAGMGFLDNSGVGDFDYEKQNKFHVLFGGGVEYASRIGLGIRAEVFSFDSDAFYSQLALVYRFGRQSQPAQPIAKAVEPEPIIETPVVPPVAAVAVVNPDKDGDGVLNESDQCPVTGPGVSVDRKGCALFAGVADGVNFYTDSARLTSEAKNKLNAVATILIKHQSVDATISAHTDSVGDETYNQALSVRRAKAVTQYLSENGVDANRLKAEAFGETQPIDSNETRAGRERNRRVEIVVHRQVR